MARASTTEILKKAQSFVKTATQTIQVLQQELNNARRWQECYKIAEKMLEKGMTSPEDFSHTVENLFNSGKDLGVLKEAVEMNNGQSGLVITVENDLHVPVKDGLRGSEVAKMAAIERFLTGDFD